MDWLAKIDYVDVVREAAQSPLGAISLFMIVIGIFVVFCSGAPRAKAFGL